MVFAHAVGVEFPVHKQRLFLVEGESVHIGIVDNAIVFGWFITRRVSEDAGFFVIGHCHQDFLAKEKIIEEGREEKQTGFEGDAENCDAGTADEETQ